jgi:UDPglucose 6-dehydrogenase
VSALLKTSNNHGYPFSILSSVQDVNKRQKGIIVDKVRAHYGGPARGRTIAVWGLAFKPNTDDMREAPSLTVIDLLLADGATVRVHDPVALTEARHRLGNRVEYFENYYETLRNADALVVITEWNEFRRPDFERMRSLMKEPVVFDGRNIYDPQRLRALGFTYYGMGRAGA